MHHSLHLVEGQTCQGRAGGLAPLLLALGLSGWLCAHLKYKKIFLKVVGIEKLGGLGVCILIEKGTGPW